ncbi:MAG: sigma 54-interacting transcriptional regulator [Magnetococcales bacterium]|nr:sigma 54-interacting transcriptional regulator [Magnetococcales bacterium]
MTTRQTRQPPPQYPYSVLLVGVGTKLGNRLNAALAKVTALKRATTPETMEIALKREPVGLIIIEVPVDKVIEEYALPFTRTGHGVPLLAIDTKESVTLLQPGTLRHESDRSRFSWPELPDLVASLLHLSTWRLDAALQRETLNAVTNSIQEGVIVVDRQMILHSINPAALNACKFEGTALGCSLLSQKGGCVPNVAALLKRVIGTMKAELNVHFRCPTGPGDDKTEIHVNATPLIDYLGHCHGAVAVILDRSRVTAIPEVIHKRCTFHHLIGVSGPMQEIYEMVESLANMDTTTLITGESGVGKELVASALHFKGRRAHGPMVKVNCSALQETLLESELFGHVKGAFTGAVRDRPGRFEVAAGGTIFLDEIGDISLSMQTRLLRVLQERELERVGDSRTIKVDVRVVAATNKDLTAQIRLGRFREDLYFRLNVVEIHVPPLRKRLDDIPLLINHFIQKFNHKYQKSIVGVHEGVLEMFLQYPWPGNIRELENAIEHAFVVCTQTLIRIKHLPKSLVSKRPCADPIQLDESCEIDTLPPLVQELPQDSPQSEKDVILLALKETQWKKKKTAKVLGISRSTLYRKMEKLDIKS